MSTMKQTVFTWSDLTDQRSMNVSFCLASFFNDSRTGSAPPDQLDSTNTSALLSAAEG